MSLWDGIKRQLRSVVEWTTPNSSDLFYKWSENGDEIKNASKLIVGPGQGCIFVYEGRVVGVIEKEGMVDLKSANIPFWTTIKKFMQGFESEHKVGLYFFKKTRILDQKWGTRSLIKYDDPKYKFPVGLMAFGNYSYKIEDAKLFFVNILGTQDHFTVNDFREVISSRISQPIADFLATSQHSYADIDAQREEISQELAQKISEDFTKLGFSITDFRIEGTEFDPKTQERIDKIAQISALSYGADVAGISFSQLQKLEAMKDAANNQVGAAGMMMGMGVAGGLAEESMRSETEKPLSAKERLSTLKELLESDLISEDEYSQKRQEVLKEI